MISEGKLLFILAAIISVASAKGWWETGISFDLTSDNWAEHVGKDKTVIVEFYATYCGYCRKMQGQWDILAEHYMGDNTNRKDVLVAKIDGEKAPIIPHRFNVHSYPTILIWRKGELYPAEKFYGARTFESFRDWIERIAGPEVKKQENIKQENILVDGLKDERMLEVGSQDLASIAEKLEFLLRVVNSEKNDMSGVQIKQQGTDVDNMKMILNDISSKINGRVFVDDEINFAHGVCFMMIGMFIGVGVSFTAINFRKLSKKKLSTKV